MDPRKTRMLLQEAQKRQIQKAKPLDLLASCFDKQREFIQNPAKRKACICPRRSGKSWGCALYLLKEALEHKNAKVLYIAKTRDSARETMELQTLAPILEDLDIKHTFNKSTLTYLFENGSTLRLFGADASEKQHNKLRGQAFRLIVVDECAYFDTSLDDLYERVLKYCVKDTHGTIVLISTPSDFTNGLFYDITGPNPDPIKSLGWKTHSWTWRDNHHKLTELQASHDDDIEINPLITETATYKQESLGQWVIRDSALVFSKFNSNNLLNSLPPNQYHYILSCDLGFNDATAWTIWAYSYSSNDVYLVHCYKQSKLIFDSVAKISNEFNNQYKFVKWIIDGANKQGIEEMRQRFSQPWQAAEKQGKFQFIQLMNSDLQMNRIKVIDSPDNQPLIQEWKRIVWNPKDTTQIKEGQDDHLSDAALYGWRECRHFRSSTKPVLKPLPEEPARYKPFHMPNQDNLDWLDWDESTFK